MKHHIIAKFKSEVTPQRKSEIYEEVCELFEHTKEIDGVDAVHVHKNCIDRSNRYDIMIVIEMQPEALTEYDSCQWHHLWKERYGALLESKAIFDCE